MGKKGIAQDQGDGLPPQNWIRTQSLLDFYKFETLASFQGSISCGGILVHVL